MARVYIGNLDDNASKREIESEFESFGPLKDVWVARNPPGFAFCVFEDKRDAEEAVRGLDGKSICGSRIRVEMARGPSRGGRPTRSGMTEKCYECGRVGHFARDCTRSRQSGGSRDGRDSRDSYRRRSRSRSPRNYRSRSRSRSPRRRRSRSHSNERKYGSHSRSHSRDREHKSPSPFRERRKDRSRSPPASPRQERSSPKEDRNNGNARRSPSKSRSPSPASPLAGTDDP